MDGILRHLPRMTWRGSAGVVLLLAATVTHVRAQFAADDAIWQPRIGATWQWQLSGPLDLSLDVEIYDLDLFDTDESIVSMLRRDGRRVVCYMSAGAWEAWRPDAGRFPPSVLGRGNGWDGERWLDIRRLDVLGPILEARLDLCRAKGFDAVEPDNVDGYVNDTGFRLTYADQLRFNRFLAEAAHARGLSIGLKNDLDQVEDLLPHFDWALNEECFRYRECDRLLPFIRAGKAVFHVEYEGAASAFCPAALALGFSSLKKPLDLGAARIACEAVARTPSSHAPNFPPLVVPPIREVP